MYNWYIYTIEIDRYINSPLKAIPNSIASYPCDGYSYPISLTSYINDKQWSFKEANLLKFVSLWSSFTSYIIDKIPFKTLKQLLKKHV